MFSNKDLRKLIFPLVIEQALVMMVGIVDTVMVSYVGEAAISGVALVDMINYLIIVVLSAIDTGGAVIVSQYLGRKDKKNAGRCASQLLLVTVLLSIAIMGICLVFHTMILELLFGAIDVGIYNSSAAIFRSMQKTKITMYVSVLINVINIAGDAIGIFVLHAGVAGVAVPTLVSRMAGAVIMLAMSFNEKNQVSVKMREIFAWNKETVKKILRIAVPNGIENGLFALGKVLVTSIVALFGTYQIAANGMANGIDQIAILVVNAINLAVVTVVGQCSGAGEYDQAEKYTKKLMKISYIATGTLGLGVCLLLPVIHGFYIISEETWKLGCILVVMHNVMAFLLHPTSFNLSNSLRASGDVKITMYIGIGSMLVFRLGTAVFLGIVCNMGIIGVWIAMGMDWLARSVAFSIRYKSGKWKKIRVI